MMPCRATRGGATVRATARLCDAAAMSEPRDPHLPHDVVEVSPLWIPMPDGTRLAGRAWLPAWASAERPVPELFELIPYRTRDLTALRDESIHGTFAAHGYASVRVDTIHQEPSAARARANAATVRWVPPAGFTPRMAPR